MLIAIVAQSQRTLTNNSLVTREEVLAKSNNLSDLNSAATARTNLGGTTIGQSVYTLTNPSAISFPRFNADNTVTARSASELKTDLSLNNVTNESKPTMFTSPTFTGNAVLGAPASGDFSTGSFTWPTFNQNTSGTAANITASSNTSITSLANLVTVGTIGTGTWQGGVIASQYGGTGVNNGGRTLTVNTNSGTIAFSNATKTLTIGNSLTFNGTDATTITFPSTSATMARTDAAQTFTGTQTFTPTASVAGFNWGSVAGDPSGATNGDAWYNSTTNKLRARQNNSNVDLVGAGSGDALVANPLSQFASTTTAQLAGVLSDETGTLGGFSRLASAKLGSDYTNATTTGTEITGLQISSTGTGLVIFEFWVLVQSGTATTGWRFGVNHTGTASVLSLNMTYPSTGTTAATGVGEDVVANNTGSIYEAAAATTVSTTTPNLGPTAGVAATTTNVLVKVFGMLNVTVSGDLELWGAAETTGTITVKTNSAAMARVL